MNIVAVPGHPASHLLIIVAVKVWGCMDYMEVRPQIAPGATNQVAYIAMQDNLRGGIRGHAQVAKEGVSSV